MCGDSALVHMKISRGTSTPPAHSDDLAQVIELKARETEHVTCMCGSVWWQPKGVTIDAKTSHVNGYAHPVVCVECGAVWRSPLA